MNLKIENYSSFYKKDDLLNAVCLKLHIRKCDVNMVLKAILDEIKDAVNRGEMVRFPEFGSFFPRFHKARKGTLGGKTFETKEGIKIVFKASQAWRRLINARED